MSCACGATLPGDCAFVAGHVDAEQRGCIRDGVPDSQPKQKPRKREETRPYILWASEVEEERVEWVVPGRVPCSMLTLLAGDPKLGKSMLSLLWAADLASRGERSLLLTAEDSVSITLKPRLRALQADMSLIGWARLERDGIDGGLSFPEDIDALNALVEESSPRLVVVDPLMAHLGDRIDSHRDHSIRRALAPLYHVAERHGCAVVVIVHLNKDSSGSSVLGRVGGSIGLSGAARSILLFARDPEDPEGERGRMRVLAHDRCTVADEAPSLRYELQPIVIPAEGTRPDLETAKLVEIGVCDLLPSDLLRGPAPASPGKQARDYLLGQLSEEWQPAALVKSRAADEGIAARTLERAAEELASEGLLERDQTGVGKPWEWRLSRLATPGAARGETDGGETGAQSVSPEVARRGETASDGASPPGDSPTGETAGDSRLATAPPPPARGETEPEHRPLLGDEDFLPWLYSRLEAGVITEAEWHQASKAHRLIELRSAA